jgi:hypothetical protein
MRIQHTDLARGGYDNPAPILAQYVVVDAGLDADGRRRTLAATGADVVTCHYAGPEATPHAWTVNGAAVSVAATAVAAGQPATGMNESVLEVTASQAGPVIVTVGGQTLTLTAA